MKTQQFYCHYTGKDGHTPRRRSQSLIFFDHITSLDNTFCSPTPLWAEVMIDKARIRQGVEPKLYLLHAQLSPTVVVYIEQYITSGFLNILNQALSFGESSDQELKDIYAFALKTKDEYGQYLDLTKFLLSHPEKITGPILNAYAEARPYEYLQIRECLFKYHVTVNNS